MNKDRIVSIFLAIIATIAIIFAIFAFTDSNNPPIHDAEDYENNIKFLKDTIEILKIDIARYEDEIQRIDLEKEKIKEELAKIFREHEKIDTDIVNGDLDYNIQFLTEYLSKKDSIGN